MAKKALIEISVDDEVTSGSTEITLAPGGYGLRQHGGLR